jgi:hypothetical protein
VTIEIPLNHGFVTVVDDEDWPAAVAAGRWSVSVKPKTMYAVRTVPKVGGGWTTTRLHNVLTGWRFVDHINGDGLDNRRVNLRPAAQSTNGANVGPRSHNASGYKGVGWHKGGRKWVAQITAKGRHYHLGLFTDPAEAARAYDAAALHHFGAFARLNFPQEQSA